ncbi:MAG: type II toxin-antitoxin system RelB/DinJ family antitoxin [Candidatus Paceibacterota bacterium]
MSEIINFRVDKKVKSEAQAIAKKMGLNLSDVMNLLLRQIVRDKTIEIRPRELTKNVKLAVHVPVTHADAVRKALGEAGAGRIGNYGFCSFSCPGTGRFWGNEKSHPAIGKAGKLETAQEERIEVTVPRAILAEVVAKMKSVHPYDEPTFDIYPIEN